MGRPRGRPRPRRPRTVRCRRRERTSRRERFGSSEAAVSRGKRRRKISPPPRPGEDDDDDRDDMKGSDREERRTTNEAANAPQCSPRRREMYVRASTSSRVRASQGTRYCRPRYIPTHERALDDERLLGERLLGERLLVRPVSSTRSRLGPVSNPSLIEPFAHRTLRSSNPSLIESFAHRTLRSSPHESHRLVEIFALRPDVRPECLQLPFPFLARLGESSRRLLPGFQSPGDGFGVGDERLPRAPRVPRRRLRALASFPLHPQFSRRGRRLPLELPRGRVRRRESRLRVGCSSPRVGALATTRREFRLGVCSRGAFGGDRVAWRRRRSLRSESIEFGGALGGELGGVGFAATRVVELGAESTCGFRGGGDVSERATRVVEFAAERRAFATILLHLRARAAERGVHGGGAGTAQTLGERCVGDETREGGGRGGVGGGIVGGGGIVVGIGVDVPAEGARARPGGRGIRRVATRLARNDRAPRGSRRRSPQPRRAPPA